MKSFRAAQLQEEVEKRTAAERHHRDEVRIKLAELRATSGRGWGFTAAQATVAAAVLAVISGIGGAFIQSMTTRDVEAGKSSAALSIEKMKVEGDLELDRQKQTAAAILARQEFETKLILKAIETPDRQEAIRNLHFFLTAGFIQDRDGKIASLQESQLPSITPPLVTRGITQNFEATTSYLLDPRMGAMILPIGRFESRTSQIWLLSVQRLAYCARIFYYSEFLCENRCG